MKKLLLALAVLCFPVFAAAADVTLAWDQSISPDVTHNRVYWGTAPGVYGTPVQITAAETHTVTGLAEDGTTFYFAVTALDAAGNESGFSNEVSVSIPDTTPPEPPSGLHKVEELTLDTHSDGTVSLRIARYELKAP